MRKINIHANNRLFFIKYLLSSAQTGFTLLESIMAVLVVSIVMTAILPMLILSTAARVQSRRVDLASQAARSYVDGVRGGVIDIINAPAGVSPASVFPFVGGAQDNRNQYFIDVPAPSSSNIANLNLIPGVKVDTTGNGFSVNETLNFVIQPMRSASSDGVDTNLSKQGYYMQVRVYRADAFTQDTSGNLTGIKAGVTLQTGADSTVCPSGQQVFTSTTGSLACPLVIMKVDVYPSSSTLDQIKSRL